LKSAAYSIYKNKKISRQQQHKPMRWQNRAAQNLTAIAKLTNRVKCAKARLNS